MGAERTERPVGGTNGSRLYVGIDPGVSGGLAAITATGDVAYLAALEKLTERDMYDALVGLAGNARAVLERVHAMPPKIRGKAVGGSVGNFRLGESRGSLRMALVAAGIPFDEVTPVKWQTAMSCRTGGDKLVSKARCQMLFPQVKATNWNADALVLAEFCRRQDRQGGTA